MFHNLLSLYIDEVSRIRKSVPNNTVVLIGTGDKVKDTENLRKAVDYLNTLPRGTLLCEVDIWLVKKFVFNKPINLIGGIFHVDNGMFSYYPANLNKKYFKFKSKAGDECITDFDTTFSMGDFITIRSSAVIPIFGHNNGLYKACPQELHRIREPVKPYLDNTIVDTMVTETSGRILNMLENFTINSSF